MFAFIWDVAVLNYLKLPNYLQTTLTHYIACAFISFVIGNFIRVEIVQVSTSQQWAITLKICMSCTAFTVRGVS